jgi:hypothetical protein
MPLQPIRTFVSIFLFASNTSCRRECMGPASKACSDCAYAKDVPCRAMRSARPDAGPAAPAWLAGARFIRSWAQPPRTPSLAPGMRAVIGVPRWRDAGLDTVRSGLKWRVFICAESILLGVFPLRRRPGSRVENDRDLCTGERYWPEMRGDLRPACASCFRLFVAASAISASSRSAVGSSSRSPR